MKKIIALILLTSSVAYSQNTFPASGNVGIGTSSPSSKLVIDGVDNFIDGITIQNTSGYKSLITAFSDGINPTTGSALQFKVANNSSGANIAVMTLRGSGNVGIGTTTPYSWSRLHIKAPGPYPWGILSEASANDKVIGVGHDGTNGIIAVSALSANGYTPLQLWTSNIPRLTIDVPGNIGIGTTAPLSKVHINSSIERETFRIYKQGNTANYLSFWQGTGAGAIDPIGTGQLYLGYDQSTNVIMGYTGAGVNSGNVGIGTPSPDAKLAVKGQIHAQEVKVDLNGAVAPDYVFASNYQLPTLDYIKTYIDQNKHLPEVPSAKEMEANGVNLGEMNMLLLKKIEELTLYVIELKKRDEAQQMEIEQLKKNK